MTTATTSDCVLTFVSDGVIKEQPLNSSRMLIGRADGCDVCFPFHREVSRLHASLAASDGVWRIEDVSSRSGTFVNGERVFKSQALKDGDVVRIGTVDLIFRRKKHADETVLGFQADNPSEQASLRPPDEFPAAKDDESSPEALVQEAETVPLAPPETIRPGGQVTVPNHYHVIGVADFESDISLIHDTAKARLQRLKEGARSEDSAALESVSAAMICLTNRRSKREYDQKLADQKGIEIHFSGDRVIPILHSRGAELTFLVGGILVLGLIAWFVTPMVIRLVQQFFSEVQQSMPAPPM